MMEIKKKNLTLTALSPNTLQILNPECRVYSSQQSWDKYGYYDRFIDEKTETKEAA